MPPASTEPAVSEGPVAESHFFRCASPAVTRPELTPGPAVFHHDGPIDALTPHRNRNGKRAPKQAFPKDSLNNVLGGSGPLHTRPAHASFLGFGVVVVFKDFAYSAALVLLGFLC